MTTQPAEQAVIVAMDPDDGDNHLFDEGGFADE